MYERLATQQTQDMLKELPQHRALLHYSIEKLQQLRHERLRALLHHAKQHSPWYHQALKHINIEHFTEQNLNELPVMNKVTLMENWDAIVTDRRLSLQLVEKHLEKINHDENELYLFERYHVVTTSGSSGTRGVFVYNWDEWNQFYIYLIRYGLHHHNRSEISFDLTRKLKVAIVNISNSIFATYSLHRTFLFNRAEKFHFPITLPFDQIIAGLNRTQPDSIIALPPTVRQLCQEANHGRLMIQPKVIITFGEPLHRSTRRLITNTWPTASLFNTYSSSEGLIGINCHANSHELHLNDDACIVEPVDQWNNPVGQQTRSHKIYLTNLYNMTLPLIRYEVPDQLVFLKKQCDCGIKHQLIEEPSYRSEFDFTYSGGIVVHHSVFDTPLLLEKNLREFQVIQTSNGANINIVTMGYIDTERLKANVCGELSRLGLKNPTVNIIEVEQIDCPKSGKLRRFLRQLD